MTEIVINRCKRGTLLSDAGKAEYMRRKSLTAAPDWKTLDRSDPDLVAMIKEDEGKRVWGGECSRNAIITVPDGFPWKVESAGNWEWVTSRG